MTPIKILKLIIVLVMLITSNINCTTSSPASVLNEQTDINKILYYASLAGSSHNTQPWKTEVYTNDSILVFADASRLLKVVDPEGKELFMSIGAFIENLEIAANALGYNATIEYFEPGIHDKLPVAAIKLIKTGVTQNPQKLIELELRTTLRIPFDTMSINENDRQKLLSAAPENVLIIPSNSSEGRYMATNELKAYTMQAWQKDAQDELSEWMRFSDKDVNSKRDGLTPAGMGIKGIGGFMVRTFMKPQDSKKESFVKAGVEKTRTQVENCGAWILISAENNTVRACIEAGRTYERMNIMCRSLNIGYHPMNQLLEIPQIESTVNRKLLPNQRIMFVARIGYVKIYPAPVSKRRPVEAFTTFIKS